MIINFDTLDVFSFGVLIPQQWQQLSDVFNEHKLTKIEVQRWQHLLNKVDSNVMKQLAEECLHNLPESRPHTDDLVTCFEVNLI